MRTTFAALFTFIIGLIIGHYNLFPVSTIRTLKSSLTGAAPIAQVAATTDTDLISWIGRERRQLFENFTRQVDVVMVGDSLTWLAEWSDIFQD